MKRKSRQTVFGMVFPENADVEDKLLNGAENVEETTMDTGGCTSCLSVSSMCVLALIVFC